MSLYTINKGTKSNPGGGLPFYLKEEHIFVNTNAMYSGYLGLWYVPNNKIPTFQVFNISSVLISIKYRERTADGGFTGFTFPIPLADVTITPVKRDGLQEYIFETSDDTFLNPSAPDGKWIIELRFADDSGVLHVYFSEEFVTKSCCG